MTYDANRDEIFDRACCGDTEARAYLGALFAAADVADDLHDKDNGEARIADVLQLLTSATAMPFFRRHAAALSALQMTAILCWDMSNKMLPSPEREHYSRQLEQVLFYVAMVCGGYAHAKTVALEWNT